MCLGLGAVALLAIGSASAQAPQPSDRIPRDQSATAGYDYQAWGMKNGQIDHDFLDKILKGAQSDGSLPTGFSDMGVVTGKIDAPTPPPGGIPRGTGRGNPEGLVIGPDGLIHRATGSSADAALLGLGPDQSPTARPYAAVPAPTGLADAAPAARPARADPSATRITAALNALQAAGYVDIKDLKAAADGVHASASRSGSRVSVIVDPKSGAIRAGS